MTIIIGFNEACEMNVIHVCFARTIVLVTAFNSSSVHHSATYRNKQTINWTANWHVWCFFFWVPRVRHPHKENMETSYSKTQDRTNVPVIVCPPCGQCRNLKSHANLTTSLHDNIPSFAQQTINPRHSNCAHFDDLFQASFSQSGHRNVRQFMK